MTAHYLEPHRHRSERDVARRDTRTEDDWGGRDEAAFPDARVLPRYSTAEDDVACLEREHFGHLAAEGREVNLQTNPMLPLWIAGIAWGLIVVMATAISPPLARVMAIAGLITGLGHACVVLSNSTDRRGATANRSRSTRRRSRLENRGVEVDVHLRVRSRSVRARGGTEGRSPAVPPSVSNRTQSALGNHGG